MRPAQPETRKRARSKPAAREARSAVAARPRSLWRWYLAGFVVLLAAAFQVYGPVLNGPFLFDDRYLGFNSPNYSGDFHFTPVRPLLMLSYWINYRLSGLETFSYHALNVLFHALNSLLVFFIVRKMLAGKRRDLLAAFAAGVFLLHPVQTESVSYVASRSENLSLLFFLAAFALFLYRRSQAISWRAAAGVLLLYGAAIATKEHTVVLAALLLVTDYYWNPGFSFSGIRRNWRLYLPVALAGAGGLFLVSKVLSTATSAGFGMKDVTWYQYFFTQCRAIFVYLKLFVFPAGLTADYDFPISRTILEHGAIIGLAAILVLIAAAVYYRRRYPLASYGVLAFLILLAPTSSFVPIKDPIAERRIYLAIIGLLFVLVDVLQRIKLRRGPLAVAMASVLIVFAALTYQRNKVWSDELALWQDTVRKAPRNARAHFQLAYAYFHRGTCDQALPHYQVASDLQGPTYDLLIDWGLAYDCAGQPEQALAKLRQAAALERTAHAYALIGMVHAKNARWGEALEALATAEKIDPAFAMTYVYRGGVHAAANQLGLAVEEYRRALALEPGNQIARDALANATARLGNSR